MRTQETKTTPNYQYPNVFTVKNIGDATDHWHNHSTPGSRYHHTPKTHKTHYTKENLVAKPFDINRSNYAYHTSSTLCCTKLAGITEK